MVNRWFGVGQFLSGAMGQLYPGGDSYRRKLWSWYLSMCRLQTLIFLRKYTRWTNMVSGKPACSEKLVR